MTAKNETGRRSESTKSRDDEISSLGESSLQASSTATASIALFGAYGKTGNHFLRLALDAGYFVRALIVPGLPAECLQEFENDPCCQLVSGGLDERKKIHHVVRGIDYVVCMLNDTLPGKKDYPKDCLSNFVRILYSVMKEEKSIQVFLYQATSLAADIGGSTPVLSKVLKTVAQRRSPFLRDQDAVIRHIASEHSVCTTNATDTQPELPDQENTSTSTFKYIVTRPTVLLKDGPSSKKLSASKSQPGPFTIQHIDLAEFSLNALRKSKYYNRCPYIVADSF